jgi:hypothetical protein
MSVGKVPKRTKPKQERKQETMANAREKFIGWVGFFMKLCSLLITNGINTLHDVYACVLLGFIVSITAFFSDILLEMMDAYIDDKKKEL